MRNIGVSVSPLSKVAGEGWSSASRILSSETGNSAARSLSASEDEMMDVRDVPACCAAAGADAKRPVTSRQSSRMGIVTPTMTVRSVYVNPRQGARVAPTLKRRDRMRYVPELPDLVVYIEALQRAVVGQRLDRILVLSPFVLRSVDPPLDALFT